MMNKELKAAWVAALRSGEYIQGKGCLRNQNDQFCCLGVLTDLYCKATGAEWENKIEATLDGNTKHLWHLGTESGILPPEVMEWAGLKDNNPEVTYYNSEDNFEMTEAIAEFNDSHDFDFDALAYMIEEQL